LMEKEIWEKSKTDTLGLKSFYDNHINNYQWKKRADVILVSSTNEDMAKKAAKLLKKNNSVDQIKQKLNTDGVVNVMTNSGVYEQGNDVLPKTLAFKKGISGVLKEGDYYFVAKVNNVLPEGPKSLDEAKGRVINNYQQHLEENWVSNLKQEFTIDINKDVFERVKKQLNP